MALIYVCEKPLPSASGVRFHLWADTSEEAFTAAAALGALDQRRRLPWESYSITPEQLADAIALGILVTDRVGPTAW